MANKCMMIAIIIILVGYFTILLVIEKTTELINAGKVFLWTIGLMCSAFFLFALYHIL